MDDDAEYKYLVRMPMDSVSEENVGKLLSEHHLKQDELDRITATTVQQMWLSELDILGQEYKTYKMERDQSHIGDTKQTNKKKKIIKKSVKKIVNHLVVEEES
jgi:hypothetical protein